MSPFGDRNGASHARGIVRPRSAVDALCGLALGLCAAVAVAAPARAEAGRTAILCAYEPEWQALLPAIQGRQDRVLSGVQFVTGTIEGKPIVLVETGISMVNATMATQLALDHYEVADLVVMGIAGGVDPALHIGDVVVPAQWSQYLESVFAREDGGTYKLPAFSTQTVQHFGMIYPQSVEVDRAPGAPEPRDWFPADPRLLDLARKVAPTIKLEACDPRGDCSGPAPVVAVGGNGVSGQSFVDNAAFRDFAHTAFAARALDMESAAVAQVAYANHVPFIAFRSLSDLAGGDAGATKMKAFEALAARNAATVLKGFLRALP